jgi:ribonuclease Z
MAILYQVLGAAGHDNALFVWVTTGQTIHRLLFDCGEGCIAAVPYADVLAVDHLLFSHLHMDHIGGFDSLFRSIFNRTSRPNNVWGPPETSRILHHRFRGFLWNLHADQPGLWHVHDIYADRVDRFRYAVSEAFAEAHFVETQPFVSTIIDAPAFTIQALHMEHLSPSMAYIIREKPRLNIDREKLEALGLAPGPWLEKVKVRRWDEAAILEIAGQSYDLAALRETLLIEKPGDSLAYLTDFILDQTAEERLIPALRGCKTVICESQYRQADAAFAERHYHMTATQAARLARRANVERLMLFHISDRYRHHEWLELLAEARAIFPNTSFPEHWGLTTV